MNLTNKQIEAINFIHNKKKCALFLKCGSGKTLIILEFLKNMKNVRSLIIAPLRVIVNTWPDEIEKWGYAFNYEVCTGTKSQRDAKLTSKHDILLINPENTNYICDKFKILPYNVLVLDESTLFKSHSSKRFKALVNKLSSFEYIILLSGTPCGNSLQGLWAQFYILDGGDRLGKCITHFRDKYMYRLGGNLFSWYLMPNAKELIFKSISDITMTQDNRNKKELNHVVINEYCNFTPKLTKNYNELKKHYLALIGDTTIIASNTGVMLNKLTQYCQGFLYKDDGDVINIHNLKIDIITSIIECNPDESFLIAYNYNEDLRRLLSALSDAEVINDNNIDRWNNKKLRILLAHPKSAGHGLNLQHGGSFIIWYSLTLSLENYEQFNHRLIRKGQNETVRIMHILVKDSIETLTIMLLLKRNRMIQEELFKQLKN